MNYEKLVTGNAKKFGEKILKQFFIITGQPADLYTAIKFITSSFI